MLRNCAYTLIAFVLLVETTGAGATAQRTFVASTGIDANPCTPVAPCRSFAAAIAQTTSNGEIIVLDSAGYGPVTINISVSLIAPPGVYASVSVSSGDGVTISTGFNSKVVLRGLAINGRGGQNGINFTSGQTLHIHDCVVSNMQSNGIRLGAVGAEVLVTGTLVRENRQSGIYLEGLQLAVLDGVRAEGNQYGVYARSGPRVTIRNSLAVTSFGGGGFNLEAATADTDMTISNSIASHNHGGGIISLAVVGPLGRLTVERSLIEDNGDYYYGGPGISLQGASTIATLTGNVIRRNLVCIELIASPSANTRGDNTVTDCTAIVGGGGLTHLDGI